MDEKIVKWRVRDKGADRFYPDGTVYVTRPITYVKDCLIPIFENGELLPDTVLDGMNLEKVGFTQEQLDQEFCENLYAENPNLAARVRQYAGILEKYGLEPTATSDEISAAIMADANSTAEEKAAISGSLLALIHDVELNYNEVTGNGFEAWNMLDKLIKYLPPETTETEVE